MRSHRKGRIVLSLLVSLAASRGASPALAAPSAAELRAARDLFAHAVADEDEGRWQDALEKLQQVLLVKDTAGVRYHVALCEENLGKLATARTDYIAADQKARSEQARDVLRLVSKKLAELEPRVPRLTLRLVPTTSDATLTIDGRPVSAGEAEPVDPGPHEVEAVTGERPAPSVSVSLREGESRSLDVELPPPPASVAPDHLPAPIPGAPPRPPLAAEVSAADARRAVLLEATGAVVLAGAGAAAYAAAAAAQTQAFRACAQTAASSPSACDAERFPVRVWDWIAAGAWTGAGVLATVAVFSWTQGRARTERVVVGPAALRLEGTF